MSKMSSENVKGKLLLPLEGKMPSQRCEKGKESQEKSQENQENQGKSHAIMPVVGFSRPWWCQQLCPQGRKRCHPLPTSPKSSWSSWNKPSQQETQHKGPLWLPQIPFQGLCRVSAPVQQFWSLASSPCWPTNTSLQGERFMSSTKLPSWKSPDRGYK